MGKSIGPARQLFEFGVVLEEEYEGRTDCANRGGSAQRQKWN